MDIVEIKNLKEKWTALLDNLNEKFNADFDVQGILFLIGVQELGRGYQKFSKDQKQDLMHIATCRLLSSYGFYKLDGADAEGWPHWKLVKKLPNLTLKEQDILLRNSILEYFGTGWFETTSKKPANLF